MLQEVLKVMQIPESEAKLHTLKVFFVCFFNKLVSYLHRQKVAVDIREQVEVICTLA